MLHNIEECEEWEKVEIIKVIIIVGKEYFIFLQVAEPLPPKSRIIIKDYTSLQCYFLLFGSFTLPLSKTSYIGMEGEIFILLFYVIITFPGKDQTLTENDF